MTKALIILAEGFEELEAVTVMDLLVRAEIKVTSAGLKPGPVRASRNTVLVPDATLEEVIDEEFDAIVLPGGLPGADHLALHQPLLSRLRKQVDDAKLVAAICAAPRVLIEADIAKGKTITSFPGALAKYGDLSNQDVQVTNSSLEIDLPLITSRGPGTAMDFALCLIEQLVDTEKRDEVEQALAR